MEEKYDSTIDTEKHISRVKELITDFSVGLFIRAENHDASKLKTPEKEGFDEYTPKLKHSTYGSEEYKQFLKDLSIVLKHHYENNSHHPEHYENGIDGMNLFDIVEMFFDWKAASERHNDGDIYKSIEFNIKRFGLSTQLAQIFINTAKSIFETMK